MMKGHVAVIDIGKTNAKLAVVDRATLSEIAVVTRPNTVLGRTPYPHFDTDAIWAFLLGALTVFHERHGIAAISVTTHGAAGALVASDGALAAPILDYEFTGPDSVAEDYNAVRPRFEETGSPRLPMGLNLGAQLYWQFAQDPGLHERTASIVTYPQYWGFRLTGKLACDVTSLGCHTDLWDPFERRFSSLVTRLDIERKIAPARIPGDVLGHIRPELAAQTGLGEDTPVYCGIHDSNASLLPHVIGREPPFSVVSTGTWVIAMTIGGASVVLDPSRDTLVNVNALGAPVPSARFMGGREFEIIRGAQTGDTDPTNTEIALDDLPILLPAVVPESGPFQGQAHYWVGDMPPQQGAARSVSLDFYLAMMTAECLLLTGHRGPIVVEGPFARNATYCDMLANATDCTVLAAASATGTSQGAALLASGTRPVDANLDANEFVPQPNGKLIAYAKRWRGALADRLT